MEQVFERLKSSLNVFETLIESNHKCPIQKLEYG